MELVVQLMLVLTLLGSFLQMSQWGLTPKFLLAAGVGILSYKFYPWVLGQSRQELNQWLANPGLMQQLATVQMMESLGFILIDLIFLKSLFGQKIKKSIRYASYFPGLMLFVAILFFQMNSFYQLSHVLSFEILGILFSILILLVFLIVPYFIQGLIPESYLRIELRYVLSFGLALCSVIITIYCQKLPYPPTSSSLEIKPLFYLLTLVAGMFLLGWIWSIVKRKIIFKWKY